MRRRKSSSRIRNVGGAMTYRYHSGKTKVSCTRFPALYERQNVRSA